MEVVPPLLRAFGPDVLVTQLGIDSYHTDPLTHLQVTTRGFVGGSVRPSRRWEFPGWPWEAAGMT